MTDVQVVPVSGEDPVRRGEQLAHHAGAVFTDALETYERLFAACGLSPTRVRALAEAARRSLVGWAPDLATEIDAFAAAARVEGWRVHALNARTEVLASSGTVHRGECSTLARARPTPLGAQTWDWHRELADAWHVVRHEETRLPFVTLTERGMLGKIGINAAGVGVHFNILGHASDATVDGVPVHALARRILDTAVDVPHARRLVEEAPLQASSCFTVLDPETAVCLEATARGVAVAPEWDGWLVHTNHFVDRDLSAGDLRVDPEPDTLSRLEVLGGRVRGLRGEVIPRRMIELLCAHEDPDGAPVCCHAAPAAPLGEGWETLATIVLEPRERRMRVHRGGPCRGGSGGGLRLTA